MDNYIYTHTFTDTILGEMNIYNCGHRIHSTDNSYGPKVRDHFLIVYVINGKGVYIIDGQRYDIDKESIFVVFPKHQVFYQADKVSPWENIWVGAYGDLVSHYLDQINISTKNPVKKISNSSEIENVLRELLSCAKSNASYKSIKCTGLLHTFFYDLLKEDKSKKTSNINYIDRALKYIEYNYNQPITIIDIASHINIDRSYFARHFKKAVGVTPIKYLSQYRVNKAKNLLGNYDLTIESIANSVGIDDQFYFSRMFRKVAGISPNQYRKNMRNECT